MEGTAGGGRCWLLRVKKKAKPAGREERNMVAGLLWSAVVGKKKKIKSFGGVGAGFVLMRGRWDNVFFLGLLETMGQVEGEEKIKNRGTGRLVKKTRRESTPSPLFSFFSPPCEVSSSAGKGGQRGRKRDRARGSLPTAVGKKPK